ncbi:hypothetical protein CASFOL_032250 [Castilleja foliolosa]|uniref:RRM domain-containing protein n=1 Tax=Castilleja foliolosa TaxID=1961234 RepID=A0ABD3C1V1_9LAMI
MSLFIGNLSSHTRPDVLEHALQRVFRRFGTCTIRLKGKFGFVDYDYPASAEKALKALQGTRVCGEPLNLSWSKQRPAAPQSVFQGGKSYEPPRRNFYPVRQNTDLRVGPTIRRDNETGPKNPHFEARKLSSSILVDKSNCYRPSDPNIYDRKNHPEDDRWGEQVMDPTNRKYLENVEFDDRYEPHHHQSDGKREPVERRQISPLSGPHEIRRHPKHRSRSRESEKEPSTSRKRQKREYESGVINHLEGANKGPSPSSVHSDYASSSSQSCSRALSSLSRSPSHSKLKSVPSMNFSQYSSTSKSKSGHSGTKTSSSQSTSRSKSPNSSRLPVEQNSKDYVDNAVRVNHSKDLFGEETRAKSGTGTFKPENITPAVETEIETKPAESESEDMKKDLSENDPIDVGSHDVEEIKYSEKEDFVGEHVSGPESDVSIKSNTSKSTRISSDEMYGVLKHYGLQLPAENKKDLPVETYFGSARLWPWEMVYYRRLKKGSISTENYSRRVAQNQEFGIVDKFIRSSSGWGEN